MAVGDGFFISKSSTGVGPSAMTVNSKGIYNVCTLCYFIFKRSLNPVPATASGSWLSL